MKKIPKIKRKKPANGFFLFLVSKIFRHKKIALLHLTLTSLIVSSS